MVRAGPILVPLLCCLSFGVGLAQEKKGDDPPRPTQPRQRPQPQGQPTRRFEQPILLTGSVRYADGSPAHIAARVELWCKGFLNRQVHTLNGLFSLPVGGNISSGTYDASVSAGGLDRTSFPTQPLGGFREHRGNGTRTHVDLTSCQLRAQQGGFQSDEISLSFRRVLGNPADVGTLVLYEAESIVGTVSSVTTMEASRLARKRFNRGHKELKKANYRKAAAELQKATKLYPEYSEAWNLLGQVRLHLQDESGAQEALELAAASDPKYLGPPIAMMELESQRSDWAQVSQWSTKILELHPHHVQAHYFRGVANLNLRHMEQAEESLSAVRASHRADDFPYAGYLLGLMLADKGEFAAAAKELRHFLALRPLAPEGARVKGFLSNWEEKGLIQGAERN